MAPIRSPRGTSSTVAELTHSRLLSLLTYDPETGLFSWNVTRGRSNAGSTAGSPHARGYLSIRVDLGRYLAHRLAWFYVHGEWPENQIDHINGIRTDNRIANLRDVTASVNQQNQRRGQSGGKTGLLGVSLFKRTGRYKSEIRHFCETKYLGYFDTAQEAHEAYLKAKRELHEGCVI